MHTLEVSLENRAYPICIGTGLLKQHELITRHLPQKRAAVITDSVVAKVEQQIRKYKERVQDHRGPGLRQQVQGD